MDKYQKFNEMLVDLHHEAVASDIEFMAFCQADAKTRGLYGTLNCSKPVLMSILCNVMEQEFDVEEITIMAGAVLTRKKEKESATKD
ncbi:hypothetical protein MMI99_00960 [Enterococcus cecorum]|uniref:hypothetical protein n=1 Tax=Enterococcus cecorum TaxID=44008 RepID=UPI001FABCD5E|nr:hypothetical protein [Enterococcus cecorum]MCJ0586569.1 hypothetical protein [Enterococcus cecorum]MCJ0591247.1 hypothetical protein [Enterococcus cecorum]